jgi:hypothetical protein
MLALHAPCPSRSEHEQIRQDTVRVGEVYLYVHFTVVTVVVVDIARMHCIPYINIAYRV